MKTYIEHTNTKQRFHTYRRVVEDATTIQVPSWDGEPVHFPKPEYRIVPSTELRSREDEDFAYWYRLGIIKTEQKGEQEDEQTNRPDTLHQATQ